MRCPILLALLVVTTPILAVDPPLPFQVKRETIHQELHPDYCWFHPRVAAIPSRDPEKAPVVICTLQKHLRASDHYSGLYFMRSDDGGSTWTKPALPPELDWQKSGDETIAVCDVTPGWHAPTQRLLAIGTKLRYSAAGDQLLDKPGSHQCAYAIYDPASNRWSTWKMLDLPDQETRFFLTAPGCVQWLVRPDGTLLIPVYTRGPSGDDYDTTVLHCRFDGSTLETIAIGDTLKLAGGRGLVEPSLAFYSGTYYLTLRNDARGYVTTSQDGLHYEPIRPWKFDDDQELGSYNTQTHWLVHDRGLFLCYTRRGADNDQIVRHRAPLFIAQVDTRSLRVMRATEQVLIPERGVMLGNFGAAAIRPGESLVTDAEFHLGTAPHPRGADGSVFASRVMWSQPNRLSSIAPRRRIVVLGDSITKGVRTGVAPQETFASLLETNLRRTGIEVDVLNQGIGGERTDQALTRLARDIIAMEPAVVTVMYGTNDSYVDQGANDSRITAKQYGDNLRTIVTQLRNAGIEPVLMTEPRWGDKANKNGVGEHPNQRLEQYVETCRLIAKETNTPLVDHFAAWTKANQSGTDIGSWTTDECHPNPLGHQKLTELIEPALRKVLALRTAAPTK